jgi:biotin operon repressor
MSTDTDTTATDTHPAAGDPRVWAEATPSKHDVAKHIIRTQLRGRGYDDRISGGDLAAKTPIAESSVRDLIAELRAEGLAVVSFGSGYFEIQDDAMLRRAMAKQERAVEKAKQTQRELARAYYGGTA